jgi:hypothetical protein
VSCVQCTVQYVLPNGVNLEKNISCENWPADGRGRGGGHCTPLR